ncbi:hypothetical protein ES703_112599 [subsurface metagenome]
MAVTLAEVVSQHVNAPLEQFAQSVDDGEERGLPRPVGPDDANKLSRPDSEGHAPQGNVFPVGYYRVLNVNHICVHLIVP